MYCVSSCAVLRVGLNIVSVIENVWYITYLFRGHSGFVLAKGMLLVIKLPLC